MADFNDALPDGKALNTEEQLAIAYVLRRTKLAIAGKELTLETVTEALGGDRTTVEGFLTGKLSQFTLQQLTPLMKKLQP